MRARVRLGVVAALLVAAPSCSDPDPQAQYGGSPDVYSSIAAETDCGRLQAAFDLADANNSRAEPGSEQHDWTTGYMVAINARMDEAGCYG